MDTYDVVIVIQSTEPGSRPVEMPYARGVSGLEALTAAGQALAPMTTTHVRTISVRIDVCA